MNDFDGARAYYRKTLELSPRGFFAASTALHTLTREQNGDLPVGTYLAYASLESMKDAAKREHAVREMVRMIPQFAPAWKEFASLCDDEGERLAAIGSGLEANPDAGTKGMLKINKALLKGKHDDVVRLLAELALDPNFDARDGALSKGCIEHLDEQVKAPGRCGSGANGNRRLTQILDVVSRCVPGARGHEAFDDFDGLDAAACADSR